MAAIMVGDKTIIAGINPGIINISIIISKSLSKRV